WLQKNRTDGCTVNAMDQAAADGDFDRLLFRHSQRTEGCTGVAFDETIKMAPYRMFVLSMALVVHPSVRFS
ncbi:hypothetical protein PHMEG_00023916, partial [Phytophthora megakarya]